MAKKIKSLKITKEQIHKMDRAARRNIEIEQGGSQPPHKVHKSKKTYTRKPKHKNKES